MRGEGKRVGLRLWVGTRKEGGRKGFEEGKDGGVQGRGCRVRGCRVGGDRRQWQRRSVGGEKYSIEAFEGRRRGKGVENGNDSGTKERRKGNKKRRNNKITTT